MPGPILVQQFACGTCGHIMLEQRMWEISRAYTTFTCVNPRCTDPQHHTEYHQ